MLDDMPPYADVRSYTNGWTPPLKMTVEEERDAWKLRAEVAEKMRAELEARLMSPGYRATVRLGRIVQRRELRRKLRIEAIMHAAKLAAIVLVGTPAAVTLLAVLWQFMLRVILG